MTLVLPPLPALRPYVERVWAGDRREPGPSSREHVLPTGQMHLAVRLDDATLRLFRDAKDHTGTVIGDAVVAGARAGYYIKDVSVPARSVGAQLRPGAAEVLFGVGAAALQGRHVSLDDLWGADAGRLRERLHAARNAQAQLDVLQSMLLARLRVPRGLHPAVAQALARMHGGTRICNLVGASGASHRGFIARFRDATGLSPKRYARVLRFGKLLRALAADPSRSMLDHVLAAGYSDQSHCIREFREFAGVTPQAWRRLADDRPMHVTMPATPTTR